MGHFPRIPTGGALIMSKTRTAETQYQSAFRLALLLICTQFSTREKATLTSQEPNSESEIFNKSFFPPKSLESQFKNDLN